MTVKKLNEKQLSPWTLIDANNPCPLSEVEVEQLLSAIGLEEKTEVSIAIAKILTDADIFMWIDSSVYPFDYENAIFDNDEPNILVAMGVCFSPSKDEAVNKIEFYTNTSKKERDGLIYFREGPWWDDLKKIISVINKADSVMYKQYLQYRKFKPFE